MPPSGDASGRTTAAGTERAAPGTRPARPEAGPRERDLSGSDLAGARVGIVVPAYRVSGQIEKVLRGIPPWVASIIVVEDASPDDTAERVQRVRDERIALIRHERNQGVGGAMATGFAEAIRQGLDVVVKMDGDDQMDPAHLPAILAPLLEHRADMVKCNRYSTLSHVQQMPPIRLIGNAGLTFLVKLASGYWNTFDPANGYLAVRTAVLERLDLDRLPRRYYFESGFLIELGILRATVQDVPASARYGEEDSSLSVPRTLLEFPPRLLHGLMRRLLWRYLVHDFTAVSVFLLLGVPLLAFGVLFGAYWWWYYYGTGASAPIGIVMTAAMSVILGFQLVLQALVLDVQNVPRVPISPPLGRI